MERGRNKDIQISIENLTYVVENHKILDGISFEMKDGEITLLVGKNGSGKTTLLRILAGILKPTAGTIRVDGKKVTPEELREISGYIFQNPQNQIIGSTVEEDVAFGLENMGIPLKRMKEIVEDILKKVELYDLRHYDPNLLSGGQLQRLAIASILALDPPLLLLDEPLSMLDEKGKKEVLDIIKKLKGRKNIIVATHELEQFDFVESVLVMENGKCASVSRNKVREKYSHLFQNC